MNLNRSKVTHMTKDGAAMTIKGFETIAPVEMGYPDPTSTISINNLDESGGLLVSERDVQLSTVAAIDPG